MAESTIKDSANVLQKGTHTFSAILGAYITGSGNYVSTFIPCLLDKSISSATLVSLIGAVCYTPSTAIVLSAFNTSYGNFDIRKNGFSAEFKFNTTQTANTPCTLNIQFSVTFA